MKATTAYKLALKRAGNYTDGVALNGVPVNYPKVVDGTWQVFDPVANAYIDTGIEAQGEQGEAPDFRVDGHKLQIKYPNDPDWVDLYVFPVAPSYTHTQTTPAAVWQIQHGLGFQPVTALTVDDTGEQIIGWIDATASTLNLLVIRFSEPLAGKAYIKI